jgi:hypothetical protein
MQGIFSTVSGHRHRCFGLLCAATLLGPAQPGAAADRSVPRIPLRPPGPPTAPPLLPDPGPNTEADDAKPAAPTVPLPADIPPLGLPSDGEVAPSFPDLPDLPESSVPAPAPPRTPESPMPAPADTPAPGATAPLSKPSPPTLPFPIWHQSPRKARDISVAERRCLLFVFSSSGGAAGSGSKQLSDEVFTRPDFNEFALAHLALANLFFTEGSTIKHAEELARENAMAAFKQWFKVRGYPTVILLGPDGKEINRWVGYRSGHASAYVQQLVRAVEGHEAVLFETERRREKLGAQGYRTWTSANGLKRFAKLLEFDAQTAVFKDESGAELKVELKQLALPDRELITRRRLGRPLPNQALSPAAVHAPVRDE